MDLVNRSQSEREAHRVQTSRDELVERIARAIREEGTVEPLGGLGCAAHPRPRSWAMASPTPPYA